MTKSPTKSPATKAGATSRKAADASSKTTTVRDLVAYCLAGDDPRLSQPLDGAELELASSAFLSAGIAAAMASAGQSRWLQLGVPDPGPERKTDFYRQVLAFAERLIGRGDVSNFFFMHKPPGLRLRFEAARGRRAASARSLEAQMRRWVDAGYVEAGERAVYEPETLLFGGPVSMTSVHGLFTVDALTWLRFHSNANAEGFPAWAFSLCLLNALFGQLGVADLEHVGIWDLVRRRLGRTIDRSMKSDAEFTEAAADIRTFWNRVPHEVAAMPRRLRELHATYVADTKPIVREWRETYFASRDASVGPRASAALLTIFHWNRGSVSIFQQKLIVEALAEAGVNEPP